MIRMPYVKLCASLLSFDLSFEQLKFKRTWWNLLNMNLFKDIENGFHLNNVTLKMLRNKNHRSRKSQRNETIKRTRPNWTKGKYINSTEWNIRNGFTDCPAGPSEPNNRPSGPWILDQKWNILSVKDVQRENRQLVSRGGNYSKTKIMKMIKK